MKNKKLSIAAIALLSVVVFLAIFIVVWFWGDSYKDFNDFVKSAEIPGLDEGAVPQGIANYTTSYTDEDGRESKQEYLFISAYMKEGPSRIYVTGTRTGYVGYVTLKNVDGSDYMEHAGGIATNCNNSNGSGNKTREKQGTLWVASEGTVYCAKKSSNEFYNIAEEVIEKASRSEGDKTIQFTTSFKANNNADFCFFYEDGTASVSADKLYVGEFYREKGYPTDESHHITTANGDEHRAFVYEYTSSYTTAATTDKDFGLTTISDSDVPTQNRVPKINKIISVSDKIQGFAITQSKQLVLSQSYGLPNSHLYYYDWNDVSATSNRASYATLAGNNFEYEGVLRQSGVKYTDSSLYVYFADQSKLLRDYSIPSMSEGLCVNGDRIYVLFESGCYKYKAFVRQRTTDVYYFTPRA